jgi:hypothetical protein
MFNITARRPSPPGLVKNIPERHARHFVAIDCPSQAETIVIDIAGIFPCLSHAQMFARVIVLDPAAGTASIAQVFMLQYLFILIFDIGQVIHYAEYYNTLYPGRLPGYLT